jgi:hypothetical protein
MPSDVFIPFPNPKTKSLIALDSFRWDSSCLGSEIPFNVNQTVHCYLELVLVAILTTHFTQRAFSELMEK